MAAPVRRFTSGVLAGSIATLLLYFLKKIAPGTIGLVPDGVAAALTTLLTFIISYNLDE